MLAPFIGKETFALRRKAALDLVLIALCEIAVRALPSAAERKCGEARGAPRNAPRTALLHCRRW
jgi:hypothetical protein